MKSSFLTFQMKLKQFEIHVSILNFISNKRRLSRYIKKCLRIQMNTTILFYFMNLNGASLYEDVLEPVHRSINKLGHQPLHIKNGIAVTIIDHIASTV